MVVCPTWLRPTPPLAPLEILRRRQLQRLCVLVFAGLEEFVKRGRHFPRFPPRVGCVIANYQDESKSRPAPTKPMRQGRSSGGNGIDAFERSRLAHRVLHLAGWGRSAATVHDCAGRKFLLSGWYRRLSSFASLRMTVLGNATVSLWGRSSLCGLGLCRRGWRRPL
jgi:hypothetical protein